MHQECAKKQKSKTSKNAPFLDLIFPGMKICTTFLTVLLVCLIITPITPKCKI